jgi:beta-lactamase superfamily II metal-dependent hydrolase
MKILLGRFLAALVCSFVSAIALVAGPQDGRLDIYWVDVEGGAATLILTPAGESVLIDTGMPGARDPGRIHQVAKTAGLEKIDHLVTTHFHLDHFGGAAELSRRLPIGVVYDNGIPERDPDGAEDARFAERIKPYREFKASRRVVLQPGTVISLRPSEAGGRTQPRLLCLGTRQQFVESRPDQPKNDKLCGDVRSKEPDTSDNANSAVLLLEFGPFRFFVGGDLTWNTEATLVCPVNRVGEVDVYQVDHHGLDVSNNPVLVRSLAPTVSIMSNGTSKGCGGETFATLQGSPSIQAMYQIHRNLRADRQNNTADEYIANLEEQCAASYIQLSVEPDGRAYSVSIPATGHRRAFRTKARGR